MALREGIRLLPSKVNKMKLEIQKEMDAMIKRGALLSLISSAHILFCDPEYLAHLVEGASPFPSAISRTDAGC